MSRFDPLWLWAQITTHTSLTVGWRIFPVKKTGKQTHSQSACCGDIHMLPHRTTEIPTKSNQLLSTMRLHMMYVLDTMALITENHCVVVFIHCTASLKCGTISTTYMRPSCKRDHEMSLFQPPRSVCRSPVVRTCAVSDSCKTRSRWNQLLSQRVNKRLSREPLCTNVNEAIVNCRFS
jgi:hypothetical protein